MFIPALLLARDQISVESTVDRQEITIGDRVRYTVTVTADTAIRVDSLTLGSNLGAFEIKDYVPREEKVREGYRIITEAFDITTFTTGNYQIPPLKIRYTGTDGERKSISTDPIAIKVKSLLTGEDAEDIKPLKGLKSFQRPFPYWMVIVGAAILLAAALFIVLYRRAKKPIDLSAEEIDTRLPWEIALQELGELKDTDFLARGEYKLFYLKLTEIFRRYLEKRYGISALERTTWEIVMEFRQLGLSSDEEKQIREFLDDCDLVKFAKFKPTAEQAEHDFERAHEFVMQTRSLPYASTVTKSE
jgi:hypothetical protein